MIERHYEKAGLLPRLAPRLPSGQPTADAGGIQNQAGAPLARRAAHAQTDIAIRQGISHRYIERARHRLPTNVGRHEHTGKRQGRAGGQQSASAARLHCCGYAEVIHCHAYFAMPLG